MTSKLLNDKQLLHTILRQTEISGVVGNDQAKKSILLACVSTLNLNSDYTLSAMVEGPVGVGKTTLVKSVLSLFPSDKIIERSRITPTALEHMEEELDRKIFFIEEASGNQGTYNTKIAISEKSLSLTTVNSVKGNHKAETKCKSTIGTSFISTTTHKPFDKELESRIVRVYPDFSDDYISHVANSIIKGVKSPKALKSNDCGAEEFREALGELEVCSVAIPYAEIFLTDGIKKMPNIFRNLKKILALMQAHTLLYQKQREQKDEGVLIASKDDYLNIKDLLEHVINPPSDDRVLLESELNDEEFGVGDIRRIYDYQDSYAYMKLKELQDNSIVSMLGKGKYRLVPETNLPSL